MREKPQRFMQGRNGYDAFSRFLIWVGMILLLMSLAVGRVLGGKLSGILWALALAAAAYSYFRLFSRNIRLRQAENAQYLRLKGQVFAWFRGLKSRWHDRKTHKYFRCPSCRTLMRAPRGKGKIRITCKNCGKQFESRT